MLFFYVRHADPIYDPDSLTPLGQRQAEALAKRIALYGIDKIYASTSNRAIKTAQPLCELTKKEMTLVDFANEIHAWRNFNVERNGNRCWLMQDKEIRNLFADSSVISLGYEWYNHPELTAYKKGMETVYNDAYEFFRSLGYEHIRHTGKYKITNHTDERVAFFAHAGFGIAFLSAVLDIPYPMVALHFDLCHSGMTVIEFTEEDGYAIPRMLTLSSDSHLYREGLPTKYNNLLYF